MTVLQPPCCGSRSLTLSRARGWFVVLLSSTVHLCILWPVIQLYGVSISIRMVLGFTRTPLSLYFLFTYATYMHTCSLLAPERRPTYCTTNTCTCVWLDTAPRVAARRTRPASGARGGGRPRPEPALALIVVKKRSGIRVRVGSENGFRSGHNGTRLLTVTRIPGLSEPVRYGSPIDDVCA